MAARLALLVLAVVAVSAVEEIAPGDVVALAAAKTPAPVAFQSTVLGLGSRRRRSHYDRRRRRRSAYDRRRRTVYTRRRRTRYQTPTEAPVVTRPCEVSEWSAFTACTATCAGGIMGRTRSIVAAAQNGGAPCPRLAETTTCGTGPCPNGCKVSQWSTFSACTKSCGTAVGVDWAGTMTRRRERTWETQLYGATCPVLEEKRACNSNLCPVDCQMSGWWGWSDCSHTCGGGQRTRMRAIVKHDRLGGKPCGATQETGSCAFFECPQDCTVRAWSPWTACSASCGTGSQARSRTNDAARFGGKACPSAVQQTRDCNPFPCPIDGGWASWGAWGACSASCAGGEQTRTRLCTKPPPEFGGVECAGHNADHRSCNTQLCFCPTCDAVAYRGNYKLRINHVSAHHLAAHGPRSVEPRCFGHIGVSSESFCDATFVLSHRCAYNRKHGKCECTCVRPEVGEARDATTVVADTSCVGSCLRNSLTQEEAAQRALDAANAAALQRELQRERTEKKEKSAASDRAADAAARDAHEAVKQAAEFNARAKKLTETAAKDDERREVAAAAIKSLTASP